MGDVKVIAGISGVGKSTVLEEALLLAETEPLVVNYGDRMMGLAREEGFADHRDELLHMRADRYKRIQLEAAESIVEESENEESVLVDTHVALKSPHGYLPGLPRWTLENLEPDSIVILDAAASEIASRREQDPERDREGKGEQELREYREIARQMASASAVISGAHLRFITNRNGKVKQAAEELAQVIDS